MFKTLFRRFREPSSWAAIGVLVGVVAPDVVPAVDGVAQIFAGLAAVAGVMLHERGQKTIIIDAAAVDEVK